MNTILQIQYQSWQKNERGGKWAQERSRIPKEKEVCTSRLVEVKEGIFVDIIGEQKTIRNQTVNDYLKIDDLSFLPSDSGLEVRNLQVQKPDNNHKLIHKVLPNSWFRVMYNRRLVSANHGEFSNWSYESNIFNIGFYSKITKDIFIEHEAEKIIDLRTDLYRLGKSGK